MTVERQIFRDAMARLGAAVNVITTDGPAGRGGFTASAVCSVTDTPPTLLVCMNRGATAAPALRANGVLCVNVLAAAQQEVAQAFTRGEMEARFAAARWSTLETTAPVLEDAMAVFDCRVVEVIERGTHFVLFAEIAAIRLGDADARGLIWFGRDYHPVGLPAA